MARLAPCLGFLVLLLTGQVLGGSQLPPNTLASHDSSQWEPEITAMLARDTTNPPPKHPIVFVGSSSIRMWTRLAADFPGLPVVNRGFGGSQLADVVKLADRIVTPLQPRQVVVYAGGNDINAGKDPEYVFGDLVMLMRHLRAALPEARLAYISSAPNPARWAQVEKVRHLNSLAEAYCRRHGIQFINVFPLMLGTDGLPKPQIYGPDRLHMNAAGYAIWVDAVKPHLR